jgi:hypothetical protein
MNYTILTTPLETFEAIGEVSVQEGTNKVLVYGDYVPTGKGKGRCRGPDQVVATIEDLGGGTYMVFSEDATLAALDPTDAGEKLADLGTDYCVYKITGTKLDDEGEPVGFTQVHEFKPGTVPAKLPSDLQPWVIDGMTITAVEPTVKSTIGGIDMQDIISKNILGAEVEL